jgi:hypothetical protein
MALYPIGYGMQVVSMQRLRDVHEPHMHPAFAASLFRWIESRGGQIGIGGGFRLVQPEKPGFAPKGKSFHQGQQFASGTVAYTAVDLVHVNPGRVHRAPNWSEVPAQGTVEAARWRVHCNVSAESWHMQPINIDGYDSWKNAGRPDPVGPIIPDLPDGGWRPTLPNTCREEDDMWFLSMWHDGSWWQINARMTERYGPIQKETAEQMVATGAPVVGLDPSYLNTIPIPPDPA